MKVFELAKELDVGAIDLVEKLKSLGMGVRNHMVSLDDDQVIKARSAYAPVIEEKPKKIKVAKRKVAKKVTKKATKVAAADGKTAKKAVRKKVVVKRKSSKDSVEEALAIGDESGALATDSAAGTVKEGTSKDYYL